MTTTLLAIHVLAFLSGVAAGAMAYRCDQRLGVRRLTLLLAAAVIAMSVCWIIITAS